MYIGITKSRSSALSINTLLIFDMQLVNGALFLNAKNLFLMLIIPLSFAFVRVIYLLSQQWTHQNSQINLILVLMFESYLFVWFISIISTTWLIITFYQFFSNKSRYFIIVVPSRFVIFWYSVFIWCLKQSQVINNLPCFFWWYVDFLFFVFFFFTFCFT